MPIQDVVNNALAFMRLRKKGAPQLTREHAMSARPVRNPSLEWRENDDGEAVVTLPRRSDLTGKFLAWMFFVPESRPLVLDDVGSFVWKHCDGEHTVAVLVTLLAKEYQVGKREMEVSLTEYLRTLGKRGMVGFLVPKEIAEELGEEGKELVGLDEVGATQDDLERARENRKAQDDEPENEKDGDG